MESETPWWVSLVVSWLPFIALIAVWVYLSKRMKIGGPGGFLKLQEAQVAETRKMNVLLERIAVALEKRS